MSQTLHVEVSRNPSSAVKVSELRRLIKEAVESLKNPVREFSLKDPKNANIKEYVNCIKFCSSVSTYKIVRASEPDETFYARSNGIKHHDNFEYHVFKLNEEGETVEFLDDDDQTGISPSWHQWLLPSQAFHDLWESLVLESDVKTQLIDYIQTIMLYSDKSVDESLIPWNKVILLHGPPGTGKTSMCKAIAQKATIRLGSRFNYGQLIEINSHSLFSKFSSESAKTVAKVFDKIQELIEDLHSIVFLLIDEVESLVSKRPVGKFDSETAFAIRTVNAVLAQIDRIKKYPNVIILTTSNLIASVDEAFLDRADLKLFIGNPSVDSIYEILATSINELIRVEIVKPSDRHYLPRSAADAQRSSYGEQLMEIAQSSVSLSGRILRKISFLTHVNFIKGEGCTLSEFLESLELAIRGEKEDLAVLTNKPVTSVKPDPDYEPDGDCEVIDVEDGGKRPRLRSARKPVRRPRGRPRLKAIQSALPSRNSSANNSTRGVASVRVKLEGEKRSKPDQRRSSRLQDDTNSEDGVIVTRNRLRNSEVSECTEARPRSTKTKLAPADDANDLQSFVTVDSKDLGQYKVKAGVKLKQCYVDLSKSIVSTRLVREYLRRQYLNEIEPGKRRRSSSSDRAPSSLDSSASPCKISKSDHGPSAASSNFELAPSISSVKSVSGCSETKDQSMTEVIAPNKESSFKVKKEEERRSSTEFKTPRTSANSPAVDAKSLPNRPRSADRPKLVVGATVSSVINTKTVVSSEKSINNSVQKAVDKVYPAARPAVVKGTARENSKGPSAITNSGEVIILDGPSNTTKKESLGPKTKIVGPMREASNQNVMVYSQTPDGKIVSVNGKPSAKGFKVPQYNCDQCDFSFYFKRELNTHYATHLDPSSLSCQQCHRTFTKPDYRKKHELKCMLKVDLSPSPERQRPMPLSVKKSRMQNSNGPSKPGDRVPPLTPAVLGSAKLPDIVTAVSATKSSAPKEQAGKSDAVASKAPVGITVATVPQQSIAQSTSKTVPEEADKVAEPKSIESDEGYSSGLQPIGGPGASPPEERLYVCALCSKSYKREASLAFHMKMSHNSSDDNEQYSCTVCGLVFESEAEVSAHEARDHNPQSTGSSYAPVSSVESSIPPDTPSSQIMASPRPPEASLCGQPSLNRDVIMLHAGTPVPPSSVNSFEKEYDNFRTNNSLEPMDFQLDDYHHCSVCGECFLNDFELNQHLQNVHQGVPIIQQPVVDSNFLLADNPPVPVPDAETVIEVETTEEFLSFLSAF